MRDYIRVAKAGWKSDRTEGTILAVGIVVVLVVVAVADIRANYKRAMG